MQRQPFFSRLSGRRRSVTQNPDEDQSLINTVNNLVSQTNDEKLDIQKFLNTLKNIYELLIIKHLNAGNMDTNYLSIHFMTPELECLEIKRVNIKFLREIKEALLLQSKNFSEGDIRFYIITNMCLILHVIIDKSPPIKSIEHGIQTENKLPQLISDWFNSKYPHCSALDLDLKILNERYQQIHFPKEATDDYLNEITAREISKLLPSCDIVQIKDLKLAEQNVSKEYIKKFKDRLKMQFKPAVVDLFFRHSNISCIYKILNDYLSQVVFYNPTIADKKTVFKACEGAIEKHDTAELINAYASAAELLFHRIRKNDSEDLIYDMLVLTPTILVDVNRDISQDFLSDKQKLPLFTCSMQITYRQNKDFPEVTSLKIFPLFRLGREICSSLQNCLEQNIGSEEYSSLYELLTYKMEDTKDMWVESKLNKATFEIFLANQLNKHLPHVDDLKEMTNQALAYYKFLYHKISHHDLFVDLQFLMNCKQGITQYYKPEEEYKFDKAYSFQTAVKFKDLSKLRAIVKNLLQSVESAEELEFLCQQLNEVTNFVEDQTSLKLFFHK